MHELPYYVMPLTPFLVQGNLSKGPHCLFTVGRIEFIFWEFRYYITRSSCIFSVDMAMCLGHKAALSNLSLALWHVHMRMRKKRKALSRINIQSSYYLLQQLLTSIYHIKILKYGLHSIIGQLLVFIKW